MLYPPLFLQCTRLYPVYHKTASANKSSLTEAKDRITIAEDALRVCEGELSTLAKTAAQLQAKVDDLENQGRDFTC